MVRQVPLTLMESPREASERKVGCEVGVMVREVPSPPPPESVGAEGMREVTAVR